MQKWESQAGSTSCMRPGARFHSLQQLEGAQQQGNDYLVSLAEYRPPVKHDWRVLRLVGTGPQQDGVHRSAPALPSLLLLNKKFIHIEASLHVVG